MARLARVIAVGFPHHVTQRGNRRQQTFFRDKDYNEYIDLLREWCRRCGVEIWAYCLMPNHVHLIAVPSSESGLRHAIGETHRRYTCRVNLRMGWRGHLWQGRFASYPMDENYLLAAARYIELNPVQAGLVEKPEEYRWSSAAAHLRGIADRLINAGALLEIAGDWRSILSERIRELEEARILKHERTGRPLGNDQFIDRIERTLGRVLRRQKPGPK